MRIRWNQVNFDGWLSVEFVPAAGKMYIQDKVEEYADEVFDLLDKGVSFLLATANMFPVGACSNGIDRNLVLEVRSSWGDVARKLHELEACYPHLCPALAKCIRSGS